MKDIKVVDLYKKANEDRVDKFIENTRSSLMVDKDLKKVEVDFEWLDLMENTIQYLDNILRNPNRFIINEEEVVKVELARRITVDSIKHLARHTNYIQEINEDDEVKPSKILNINKDESYDTYENRFIFTLIQNMESFLEIKKKSLLLSSSLRDVKKCEYHAKSKVGLEQISMEINFTSSLIDQKEPEGDTPIATRIQRLDDNIKMLTSSEVYKTLKSMHVAKVIPPIKKTNVILKNTNFQYAMILWDYLQEHVADASKVVKENKKYEDNGILKEYINNTFLLNYLAMNTLSEESPISDREEVIEELTDNLIQKIVELNVDLPLSALKDKIGEKIAITKYKKEASLYEIQNTFSEHIKNYLEKIESISI